MLASVLARDTHQASATETLRQEYESATSDERVEQLYRHGVDLAARDLTAIAHRIRHVTRNNAPADELPTPPLVIADADTELAAWLAQTRQSLTADTGNEHAPKSDEDLDDFTASYLEHRAAERESGPAVDATTRPPLDFGPTGPDTSADLW